MFEQCNIIRLIQKMIRSILRLIFNIEYNTIDEVKLKDNHAEVKCNKLVQMSDNGKINEDENKLF